MYANLIKRILDILFSIVGLIFFLIIFIIVAPLIWLEDKGSVFYKANRLGRYGRVFDMYKFRTMRENAPDIRNEDGSTFNSDYDPRVTNIGSILRKTSIDELPQLINVLKGDMSFIGPRPMNEIKGKKYGKEIERILTVKPGITGYSQAFYRNSITQEEKRKNDIYYVENISFKLDARIFFYTIYSVLKQKNINNSEVVDESSKNK